MTIDLRDALALDATPANRVIDKDGHLHVAESNISRAAVNGYLGREIPEFGNLGLLPDKLYQLFRDPAELAKATDSFNGKPLLIVHRPQIASDHDRTVVVGAVRDPVWKPPFMTASLDIWDGAAIDGIATGEQCQLSSAYRYKAVMTPGEFDGVAYDGVMTNILCNHVSLVEAGRAGDQVIVGDQAIPTQQEITAMAQQVAALSRSALLAGGALRTYLRPKLATDAMPKISPILATALAAITAKTWKADKAKLKIALDAALPKGSPLLAKDADIADVVDMLDQLDEMVDQADPAATADPQPVKKVADPAVDADPDAETEEEKKARLAKRAADKAARDAAAEPDKKDMVTKPAMDAALAKVAADTEAATVARMRGTAEAERFVRPWIGDLVIGQDTAAAVYKLALDTLGVDIAGVDPSAFKAVLLVQPKPGETATRGATRFAQDAAGEEAKFRARYPGASKLVRS
jgi:hypothetical protein